MDLRFALVLVLAAASCVDSEAERALPRPGEKLAPVTYPCPPEGDGGPSRDCLARCIEGGLARAKFVFTERFEHYKTATGAMAAEMDATVEGGISLRLAALVPADGEVSSTLFGLPEGAAYFRGCDNRSVKFEDRMTHLTKRFALAISSSDPANVSSGDRLCLAFQDLPLDACKAPPN